MNTSTTTGIIAARQAHSSRCRQRVTTALSQAVAAGEEISVSAIARKAGVDRSFLYRHRDLHAVVLATAAEPAVSATSGPTASRASLSADLANARDRITRLSRENTRLQRRLSEQLGQQAWQDSGLGAPADIDQLHHRITELEQRSAELRRQLAERDEDLDAARATNRELMTRLNRSAPGSPWRVPVRPLRHTCGPPKINARRCLTCSNECAS